MPLQSIIVVFLRITAIQVSVGSLLGAIPFTMQSFAWISASIAVVNVGFGLLIWFFAEPVARLVIRGHDTDISLGGLTRGDLFSFAFVYLGISFTIGSIGSVATWLTSHFASTVATSTSHQTLDTQPIGEFVRHSIQLLLGLTALLNADRFAKKLAERGL